MTREEEVAMAMLIKEQGYQLDEERIRQGADVLADIVISYNKWEKRTRRVFVIAVILIVVLVFVD